MSEPMTAEQAERWVLRGGQRLSGNFTTGEVATFIRAQSARVAELEKEQDRQTSLIHELLGTIRELESAARWRSCKDEPPENAKYVLCRSAFIEENQMRFHFVDSFYKGIPKDPHLGHEAVECREIT